MLAEETVGVALPATQSVALSVEGHAGDNDEVEVACVGFVLWLQDVEVAHGEVGVFAVFHRDDVVAEAGMVQDENADNRYHYKDSKDDK